MLPPIVTIVPLFLMLRQAHLLNSLQGLALVYTAFNLPFVIWMMRGFFDEVPREMEEAAMLDGESRAGALWRIVLPLVKPGLAATAVFCNTGSDISDTAATPVANKKLRRFISDMV